VATKNNGCQIGKEGYLMDDVKTNDLGDIILETRGLTKHYGGVHALEGANFTLRKGEHVAIVGDNGAGKSTFVRQITGVEQRTRGDIIFDGKSVNFVGPLEAREAGIETVFQTLALADDLDVPDNIFLGREMTKWDWLGPFRLLDYKSMRQATIEGLNRTAVKIPNIRNTIRNMSGGQRQCVAIARTASFHSKLTIMDEPTAALGVQETAQVEAIIKALKENGEPLILISHNMRQVFDLVDRIIVFRRGRICANLQKGDTDPQDVVAYITGAKTGKEYEDTAL
jgi:fructose transport system ATP-binding protein